MAHGDKVMSLAEKKEIAGTDEDAIRRQVDEFNSWMDRLETMDRHRLKQYKEQNEDTFSSQKKDAMKNLQKDKTKKRRNRKLLSPIMGAVLKFHKRDDVDPEASGASA